MNSTQLKWQKFAGYALPILFAWLVIIATVLMTLFIGGFIQSQSSKTDWVVIPIILCWLVLIPITGHVMGIINVYCWRNQSFDEGKVKESMVLLAIFWLLSLPLAVFLILSFIGIAVFPIHMACFWFGQERGKRWIRDDSISRFLGKKNEWERDESN